MFQYEYKKNTVYSLHVLLLHWRWSFLRTLLTSNRLTPESKAIKEGLHSWPVIQEGDTSVANNTHRSSSGSDQQLILPSTPTQTGFFFPLTHTQNRENSNSNSNSLSFDCSTRVDTSVTQKVLLCRIRVRDEKKRRREQETRVEDPATLFYWTACMWCISFSIRSITASLWFGTRVITDSEATRHHQQQVLHVVVVCPVSQGRRARMKERGKQDQHDSCRSDCEISCCFDPSSSRVRDVRRWCARRRKLWTACTWRRVQISDHQDAHRDEGRKRQQKFQLIICACNCMPFPDFLSHHHEPKRSVRVRGRRDGRIRVNKWESLRDQISAPDSHDYTDWNEYLFPSVSFCSHPECEMEEASVGGKNSSCAFEKSVWSNDMIIERHLDFS